MRKGFSSQQNNSTRRTISSFQSASEIDVVKEQYISTRQRCQRELGAGIGVDVLDTSYHGLLEWIRDERLTRLPHRGGCWDRVLKAAQHFIDQVFRLGRAIEAFAPDSGAASNLVFGQCLLLLDRVCYLSSDFHVLNSFTHIIFLARA